MSRIHSLYLALALALVTLVQAPAAVPPSEWNHVMGNPSGATHVATNRDNYLMEKTYYTLSYNNSKGIPNWVSWHVSADHLGTAARKPRFDTDLTLPEGFVQIAHTDYNGSGFDRGHMCPHSDRAANLEMSYATFVMTNIIPQSPENNQGAWEALERYGRWLVSNRGKDLFIVSGGIGEGGAGRNQQHGQTINRVAHGKVSVPAKTFKVIMAVNRERNNDPKSWVDADTRLIAVIMPNDRSVPQEDWARYRTTVAEVERQTGYTFFSEAPQEVVAPKKLVVDAERIPVLPGGHHH